MQTLNLHRVFGSILANQGVWLALGVALTVIWLIAALVSAVRRSRCSVIVGADGAQRRRPR